MKPVLFESTATDFNSNGLGLLNDAVECTVTEERNGSFELYMSYPVNGVLFDKITQRSIIVAKNSSNTVEQPFRVYRITKPLGGVVEVFAAHISYDLSGIVVESLDADSAGSAMTVIQSNTVPKNPFTMFTDISTSAKMKSEKPVSVRQLMGGVRGSLIDVYGGEYLYDGFTVKLLNHRGRDNGVSIRYGKNLTDLKQDENCAAVKTAIYPFWTKEEKSVTLTEKTVKAPGTYDFEAVAAVDFSNEWDEAPTEEQLRKKAESYVKNNRIGVPKISLKVSFVSLDRCEEYKGKALLERVNLCDTVSVIFPEMGVDANAKVVKTVYNVLLDRMESVELGEARGNIANTIAKQENDIGERPSFVQVSDLTKTLLGAAGGCARLIDTDADGEPDTLYIADNADPAKAVKVWRFNYEGWGASTSGYSGPYIMGATFKDGIVADFITAGVLNANLIKTGVLTAVKIQSVDEKAYWDLENNELKLSGAFKSTSVANGQQREMELDESALNLRSGGVLMGNMSIVATGEGAQIWLPKNGTGGAFLNYTGLNCPTVKTVTLSSDDASAQDLRAAKINGYKVQYYYSKELGTWVLGKDKNA